MKFDYMKKAVSFLLLAKVQLHHSMIEVRRNTNGLYRHDMLRSGYKNPPTIEYLLYFGEVCRKGNQISGMPNFEESIF